MFLNHYFIIYYLLSEKTQETNFTLGTVWVLLELNFSLLSKPMVGYSPAQPAQTPSFGLKIALLFARLHGRLLTALGICNTFDPSPILFAVGPHQLTRQT